MEPAVPFWLQALAIFAPGCCLGSFFNVVIHRLPAGQSLVHPGSFCPHCGYPIPPYDNIPVLSYLLLRGRCRSCKSRISPRYPIVELLTGGLALLLFLKSGWTTQFLIDFLFMSLLLVIAFIDLNTYLIPDVLSLSGIILGFGCSFVSERVSWIESLIGILLGGGFFYLVALGYQLARKKDGLGGGDIKLLAMIGAFVGWPGAVFTVLTASLIGSVVGIVAMRRTRDGLSTMLPFGPFLSLGGVLYLLWGEEIYHWYVTRMLGW
jgi:leader peptidase (prepilin peptidase) / N-methyltransferase